jgi:hypothetical protein
VGGGVVWARFFVVFGVFVELFFYDFLDVGFGEDLESLKRVAEGSCGGIEAEMGLAEEPFDAAAKAFEEENYDDKGEKGHESHGVHDFKVHVDPLGAVESQDGGTEAQECLCLAALVQMIRGLGLVGRGALEEGGTGWGVMRGGADG